MSRFVDMNEKKNDLTLLEMVSRYHQVMSNPQLFQDVRAELDARLNELSVKSKELDEKQVRFNSEMSEGLRQHETKLSEMKDKYREEYDEKIAEANRIATAIRTEAQAVLDKAYQTQREITQATAQQEMAIRGNTMVDCDRMKAEAEAMKAEAIAMKAEAVAMMAKAQRLLEVVQQS